jgi:penicillin-binding protein 1A
MFKKILLGVIIGGGFLVVSAAAIGGYAAYDYVKKIEKTLPSVDKLKNYNPSLPTLIYSSEGTKIGELFEEKRYPVALSDVSQMLVKSFLAAEDARFYEHSGVDVQGLMRATIAHFLKQGTKQGGSTITQQLVKNVLLTRERTIERKVKDILLSLRIEKTFSKDEILEMYLNTIFLGNNSYGVEAAARNYFRKSAKKLKLSEAAMIAGLAPAPSAYAPTENFDKAKTRQKFVLDRLVQNGWIDKKSADTAYAETLSIYEAGSPNTRSAPYFLMEVKKQLENSLQLKNLLTAGYKVQTSLNLSLQKNAQATVEKYLEQFESKKAFRKPITRHGSEYTTALEKLARSGWNSEEEDLRGIVIDLIPSLDIALIATQTGPGILLAEDHRWALRAAATKKTSAIQDFADILAIGDEVHVKKVESRRPKRINKENYFEEHAETLKLYGMTAENVKFDFYQLTDTEGIEAAAIIMDAQSGDVLTMVGGSSFQNSQFNRATQALRQVGSSVKPLYYGLALDKGFSPASRIDSPPIVLGDWKPENYTKEFTGRTNLRTSLVHSYNISSIQLFKAMGIPLVSEHFKRLGLPWTDVNLAHALGAGSATLLQMVQAYTPFANAGKIAEAHYITGIEDRDGKTLVTSQDERVKASPVTGVRREQPTTAESNSAASASTTAANLQVLSPAAAYVATRVMQDVIRFGTGNRAQGIPFAAGKTGTTNGYTDAWFIGFTPRLVCAVWIGFDDAGKSLGDEGTGGKMAAPLWKLLMDAATQLYPSNEWIIPANVVNVRVGLSGERIFGTGGIVMPAVAGSEPGSSGARDALGLDLGSPLSDSASANPDTAEKTENYDDSSSLRRMY